MNQLLEFDFALRYTKRSALGNLTCNFLPFGEGLRIGQDAPNGFEWR